MFVKRQNNGDDESINVFETDFWKETTPGMLLAGYRLKHEMTQEQLAEKSGIRQSNISRIENGNAIPRLDTLQALAVAMGKNLKISMI